MSKTQFIKHSVLFGVVNLAAAAISYVVIILVSRKGGQLLNEWYALNGIVTLIITLTAGFSVYYSKVISRKSRLALTDANKYLSISLQYIQSEGWKWLAAICVILGVIASFLDYFTLVHSIILTLAFGVEIIAVMIRMYYLGILSYDKAMWLTIIASLTRFFGIVTLLYANFGIEALVWGTLLGSAFSCLASFLFARNIIKKESLGSSEKRQVATDFFKTFQASGSLLLASAFLNGGQVIVQGLPHKALENEYDTITLLTLFGSILFFGANSFLSIFVVNATRTKDKKLFYLALLGIIVITILGILLLWLLWPMLLSILKKEALMSVLPQLLQFSLAILLYNIFFLSLQYLMSQFAYRRIMIFIPLLVLFCSTISIITWNTKIFTIPLSDQYILVYILYGVLFAATGVYQVMRLK